MAWEREVGDKRWRGGGVEVNHEKKAPETPSEAPHGWSKLPQWVFLPRGLPEAIYKLIL